MSSKFRDVDRGTPYLLPSSLDEWLPEDRLAAIARAKAEIEARAAERWNRSLAFSHLFSELRPTDC